MKRRPPRSTRTDTLFPYTTLFRSESLRTWRQEGVTRIVDAWLPLGHPVGTPLHVSEQGVDGTFDGLASDGALRLRREGGEVMLLHSGDIELRRPLQEGNKHVLLAIDVAQPNAKFAAFRAPAPPARRDGQTAG